MSPCFNIRILHIFSLGFLSAVVNMTFTAWEGFDSFGSSVYFSNTLTLIHIPWGRKGWVKQKDNTRQIMSRTSLKLKGAFILWKLFGDEHFKPTGCKRLLLGKHFWPSFFSDFFGGGDYLWPAGCRSPVGGDGIVRRGQAPCWVRANTTRQISYYFAPANI